MIAKYTALRHLCHLDVLPTEKIRAMLSNPFFDLRQLAHPIMVHFPIALLLASVALDWLGYMLARPGFTRAGFYALVLGAAGAGVAALLGPDHVSGADARALLDWHQLFALLTVLIAVSLVAIRFLSTGGIRGGAALAYLASTVALVAAVSLTGYFGGELTYHLGVGVTSSAAGSQGAGLAVSPVASAPRIAAKPLIVLIGFLSFVAVGLWLAAGRAIAPRFSESWWQAVQRVGVESGPLWTVRRAGPSASSDRRGSAPMTPPRYGPSRL
jgi:uncharacterized membrane protein